MSDLKEWLKKQKAEPSLLGIFEAHSITTFKDFLLLSKEKLESMLSNEQEQVSWCLERQRSFRKQEEFCKLKVFQDSIHGSIELHPLLVKIIDTPQFQRLRDIKQLGGVYHVYPGASHNRFEHSIGVCYLAGELIDSLARRQPELNIDDCDILCVKIAALCHDMGHGPYSHLYQDLFIPVYHKGWKHEEASVMLMNYMMETNEGLKDHFKYYGLDWSRDDTKCFISELILGEPEKGGHFKGRGVSKRFLYEIVANKVNGIDVDKMDYLLRDSHGLGIKVHFDWKRYITFARVIKADKADGGVPHICLRKKMAGDIYELFNIRDRLFKVAYQHKTKRAIELMFLDAMKKMNDIITIPGKKGKLVKMSDAINDMEAFTKLTDSIFHVIAMYPIPIDIPSSLSPHSSSPPSESDHTNDPGNGQKIREAQQLLLDIQRRRLYMFIGKCYTLKSKPHVEKKTSEELIVSKAQEFQSDLDPAKCEIEIIQFNYGAGKGSPINAVFFYEKGSPDEVVTIDQQSVSLLLPKRFAEQELKVYYKQWKPEALNALKKGFDAFRDENPGAFSADRRGKTRPSTEPSPDAYMNSSPSSSSESDGNEMP